MMRQALIVVPNGHFSDKSFNYKHLILIRLIPHSSKPYVNKGYTLHYLLVKVLGTFPSGGIFGSGMSMAVGLETLNRIL